MARAVLTDGHGTGLIVGLTTGHVAGNHQIMFSKCRNAQQVSPALEDEAV